MEPEPTGAHRHTDSPQSEPTEPAERAGGGGSRAIGGVCVLAALVCDALLPNYQKRVLLSGVTVPQLLFYQSVAGMTYMAVASAAAGPRHVPRGGSQQGIGAPVRRLRVAARRTGVRAGGGHVGRAGAAVRERATEGHWEVVMAACSDSYSALRHASSQLKEDPEIILAAMVAAETEAARYATVTT